MPFPFTFKLSTSFPVPNPFLDGKQDAEFFAGASINHDADPLNLTRKFPHSPSVPASTTSDDWTQSRKRSRAGERIGVAEKVSNNSGVFHARPTTGLTFVQGSGYLDTRAKYRKEFNMGSSRSRILDHRHVQSDEDDEELMQEPPTKRRRGLAGAIVSTALSAALVGTAVGLTVYRLWRDRGNKEEVEECEPPPPYTASSHQVVEQRQRTPTSPSSSITHFHATAKKSQRKIAPKRKRKIQPSNATHVHRPPPEFDFAHAMDTTCDGEFGEGTVDEHISSLSSKLNLLIEEGRKALGREIVVDGDDSEGPWQDEDEDLRRSTSRSPRKRARERSSTLTKDVSYRNELSASASSPISISRAAGEDSSTWEGRPHLEEEMRRARERVLAQRGRAN